MSNESKKSGTVPHLWEYPEKYALVLQTPHKHYASWTEWLTSNPSDTYWDAELIYWKWRMSVKRGIQERNHEVLEHLEEMQEDDDNFMAHLDPEPIGDIKDDLSISNYHYDREYMVIYLRSMYNRVADHIFKIYVTPEDEPAVIKYLKQQMDKAFFASGVK